MGMKEDIMEVQKEVKSLKEESFAMELLHDYKKTNKRQFITIIIILVMWFLTIGYLVYIMSDIGVVETTQEVSDIDTINGSVVNNGDVYGEN